MAAVRSNDLLNWSLQNPLRSTFSDLDKGFRLSLSRHGIDEWSRAGNEFYQPGLSVVSLLGLPLPLPLPPLCTEAGPRGSVPSHNYPWSFLYWCSVNHHNSSCGVIYNIIHNEAGTVRLEDNEAAKYRLKMVFHLYKKFWQEEVLLAPLGGGQTLWACWLARRQMWQMLSPLSCCPSS